MLECGRRRPWTRLLAMTLVLSCVGLLNGQEDGAVAVKWALADSTATVGRLFRMHIPGDAFSGNVLSYKVQSSDGSPLPSWLEFDGKNNVLQGIPTPSDMQQLDLEITAQGPKSQASVTTTIFVRDVLSHTSGVPLRFKTSGPEFVRCKEKEPETVATIIIDTNLESLDVPSRLNLLQKFVSHMELHEDMIKILPVGHSPMHDNSALVSGTGDCLTPKTSGLSISWPVGCGQVKEGHFPALQKLDDDSGSGRIAKVLGHPVIEWRVTNSHFQAPTRKRRQVQSTPTPVVTPILPTKTDTKQQEKTDDVDGKMTHQVVITQSPTFIHPTVTQQPTTKTDDPVVLPPVNVDERKLAKIAPTETITKVTPVSMTQETPAMKPTTSKTPDPTDSPVISSDCIPGQKPEIWHEIPKLVFHAGDIFNYEIPEDTFEDCEVGGTRGLQLMLFRDVTDNIEPDFFIQFDSSKQRIIGMPMEKDVSRHYIFNLIAKKKSDSIVANIKIIIQIKSVKNPKRINHELSVTIDYDYDAFMRNLTTRIDLANRVASVYGDTDAKLLTVTKVARGSVVYGWTNSSLASRDCPADQITKMVRKLVDDDGNLNKNAVKKLKPFILLGADVVPAGTCENNPDFPVVKQAVVVTTPQYVDEEDESTTTESLIETDGDGKDVDMKGDNMPKMGVDRSPSKTTDTTTVKSPAKSSKDEDDILITTIIPAIVIVVILLIALLIACILYRKKRKGKMNVEEQNTFINKGAPVIFPDELEDKPSDVNKPLLLEGSLSPPPEYHRGNNESPERHATTNYRNNKNNINSSPADDSITEMPEKPYEPPPPVTASSNNKQPRTTHQQQPYSQPPQILP
uniref:Dystroglycan 1 n=1 Tax=Arion vulgaris TaxID=1028688 RepID=A0A0B7AZP8_9EUPU